MLVTTVNLRGVVMKLNYFNILDKGEKSVTTVNLRGVVMKPIKKKY